MLNDALSDNRLHLHGQMISASIHGLTSPR